MLRRLAPLPAAVVLLAGCSTTIDDAAGEKVIRQAMTQQFHARLRSVTCPDGLTAKKGQRFRCRVTGADGTTGDAIVTERDDKGKVSIRTPFLHVRDIERSIASGIAQQVGSDVDVRCPEIVVVRAGDRFECTAVSGSRRTRVTVRQRDAKGRVRYTFAG